MASSMGSHAAMVTQREAESRAARVKGSAVEAQHNPRWTQHREADERGNSMDYSSSKKSDVARQESFLESLDRTAGAEQSNQSLLARLDMCEQNKSKALNRLAGQDGMGADALKSGVLHEEHGMLSDGSEDEGGAESVTAASDVTIGGRSDVTPSGGSLGPYDGPSREDSQAGMDWKNWDAASACGGKGGGSVGTRDEDDENEHQSSCQRWCAKIPVLSPTGWFRSYWDWFVISLVLYVAVMVPLQATFLAIMENWEACAYITQPDGSVTEEVGTWVSLYKGSGWLILDGFDNFVDMVFIADLILNFNTGYMDKFGTMVSDRGKIAMTYVRGFFFVDLISSIPFDKFIPGGNVGAVSILKCIRLLRLGRLMKKLDQMENANAFRVVKLMLGFTLFTHWMACLWFMTGTYGKDPSFSDDVPYISWVWDIRSNFPACAPPIYSVSYWYMLSFYWALTTLTSVGYGDITPLSVAEVWFTILVELLGNVISAVIVGNVAVLLAAYEAAYQRYRDRIETLSAFTQIYEIPKDLAKRMLVAMDHFFQKSQGLEFKGMLSRVSPSLRSEVQMVLFGSSITQTNLFKDAPEPVVKALCAKVDLVEYFTDDYIVRAGDPGTHLYICHTGRVQIVPKNQDPERAKKSRAYLDAGALFGEMPVFSGKPHLTHIRCIEPCELLHLSKYDLEDLLVDFPDFMGIFKERVKNKMHYLRHMRTVGQAPPEMLELHGLEAPQFVKPSLSPDTADKDGSTSVEGSPGISSAPGPDQSEHDQHDKADTQELPYFPKPSPGEADSVLQHIIEESGSADGGTPSFTRSPTQSRIQGAQRVGPRPRPKPGSSQ